jgi:hypothetical protein
MLRNAQIETSCPEVNGSLGHAANGCHGADIVSGRGLAHRPFADRLALGVDVALGRKKLDPSLGQIAICCRVTHAQLREAIRGRVNGNGHNGSGNAAAAIAVELVAAAGGIDQALTVLSTLASTRS